nr:unnamed protein product [Callosobruchus analis]
MNVQSNARYYTFSAINLSHHSLLTTLRYFATGAHIESIADFMGMHQTTAIRHTYCIIIWQIPEQRILARDFYHIARFPNVIGSLDCTHIRIKSPGLEDCEVF